MKCAVICEFNPLHTGHKKLLDFARETADDVLCIMSGNFVQRGMPAVANKYKRAAHAVKAGADLVVELPVVFSAAAAENFALGGVMLANKLGADVLLFGSECGDVRLLEKCACRLEEEEVNAEIRRLLKEGVPYPAAVSRACGGELLQKPNNVLGVEYISAIKKLSANITPVTIKREDNRSAPQQYASSTALREDASLRDRYTFPFVAQDIKDDTEKLYCDFAVKFMAAAEIDYLAGIADVTEGLQNRIHRAEKWKGFEHFISQVKTKRYTRVRLQRIILNCILGITDEVRAQSLTTAPQINVLAVNGQKTHLLKGAEKADELTRRADELYQTFEGLPYPKLLQKL